MVDHFAQKKKALDGGIPNENEEYWMARRKDARDILENQTFDIMIVGVILCNAATIGIEQSLELVNQDTTVIQVIETIFLVVYIFELGLRQFGHGFWECMSDPWVRFDCFLVILGLTTTIMSIAGQSADALGPLMVLRSARLLRLAKTARMLMKFREFWMLIRGLINSLGVMFYTLTILTAILYVFSSVAIELITKHSRADRDKDAFNEDFRDHVDLYFASLPQAMMTLMSFVCVDNMAAIYKPLVEQDPTLAFFFITVILVVSIIVTNLITAVIVNSTLEQNILDKEMCEGDDTMKFKDLVTELREMFMRLDDDQSGNITQNEFLHIADEDKETLCRAMQVDSPSDIFKALDIDQSGYVNIHEFCDGIWQVIMSKAPPEVKRMEKQVNVMHWHLKETDAIRAGMLNDVMNEIKEIKLSLKKLFRKGGPLCSTGPVATALTAATAKAGAAPVLDDSGTPAWALEMMRELKGMRSGKAAIPSPDASFESCHQASPASRTSTPAAAPTTSAPQARSSSSAGKRSGRATPPRKPPAKAQQDETLTPLLQQQATTAFHMAVESPPKSPGVAPPKSAKMSKLAAAETPPKSPTSKLETPPASPGTHPRIGEDIPGAGIGAAAKWTPPQSSVKAPQDMCAFGGDVVSSSKGRNGLGTIKEAIAARQAAERSPRAARVAQL